LWSAETSWPDVAMGGKIPPASAGTPMAMPSQQDCWVGPQMKPLTCEPAELSLEWQYDWPPQLALPQGPK
jgi:hypothetical protein